MPEAVPVTCVSVRFSCDDLGWDVCFGEVELGLRHVILQ